MKNRPLNPKIIMIMDAQLTSLRVAFSLEPSVGAKLVRFFEVMITEEDGVFILFFEQETDTKSECQTLYFCKIVN